MGTLSKYSSSTGASGPACARPCAHLALPLVAGVHHPVTHQGRELLERGQHLGGLPCEPGRLQGACARHGGVIRLARPGVDAAPVAGGHPFRGVVRRRLQVHAHAQHGERACLARARLHEQAGELAVVYHQVVRPLYADAPKAARLAQRAQAAQRAHGRQAHEVGHRHLGAQQHRQVQAAGGRSPRVAAAPPALALHARRDRGARRGASASKLAHVVERGRGDVHDPDLAGGRRPRPAGSDRPSAPPSSNSLTLYFTLFLHLDVARTSLLGSARPRSRVRAPLGPCRPARPGRR